MQVHIRPATKDDFKEWAKMRCELWPTTSESEHLKEIEEFFHDKKAGAYFATYDNKLIGFMEFYVRPFANGCDERPVVFLEGIWVYKAWRRKKVAAALIYRLEEWAKEHGFKEIGSDTNLNNTTAHNAHQSWGFKETSRVVYFNKKLS